MVGCTSATPIGSNCPSLLFPLDCPARLSAEQGPDWEGQPDVIAVAPARLDSMMHTFPQERPRRVEALPSSACAPAQPSGSFCGTQGRLQVLALLATPLQLLHACQEEGGARQRHWQAAARQRRDTVGANCARYARVPHRHLQFCPHTEEGRPDLEERSGQQQAQ